MPSRCGHPNARRARALFTSLAIIAGLPLATATATPAAAQTATSTGALSAAVVQQINAIEADKAARTPAQRKLDSQLIFAAREARGQAAIAGVSSVHAAAVALDSSKRVQLDVKGTITAALRQRVTQLGGTVVSASPRFGDMRIQLSLAAIDTLAAEPSVSQIRPADEATTRKAEASGTIDELARPSILAGDSAARSAAAAATSPAAAKITAGSGDARGVLPAIGSATSEGDVTHKVDVARSTYGADGTGIKIGVLSDGVTSLATRQASGDLGPVTVLPGRAGSGDEGTAMLEIIHDLAPGAQLYFATAFSSQANFAQNILDLRAAGCDIIVDDVAYFAESVFQDGVVAQAVNSVVDSGGLYFSSAGNSGNLDDHTSGAWEGDFTEAVGVTVPGITGGTLLDFDPSAGVSVTNQISRNGSNPAFLKWSDPNGASANDYDFFLLNPTGTAVELVSNANQTGTQDPIESFLVPTSGSAGRRVVVLKRTGAADRFLNISLNRSLFATTAANPSPAFATSGQIYGHAAAKKAIAVAAAPAHDRFATGQPTGPFPGVYTNAQVSETFTTDGPRQIFYDPNGSPITPGNVLTGGGTVVPKPDLTAADGVVTTTPGFIPFFGTSAAAPHAAAIAGLVWSAKPTATGAQVKQSLLSSAIDIEAAGNDRDTGAGIVMADAAMTAIGAAPAATLTLASSTVTPVAGDGDAFLEPGETAEVAVSYTNVGGASATNVHATLSFDTTFGAVQVGSLDVANLSPGASAAGNHPFRFRVKPSCPCGKILALTITATYGGGVRPSTTSVVKTAIGQAALTPTDIAYAGVPVAIPDNSTVGASATAAVGAIGAVSSLTFSIDGSACSDAAGATTVGLDHTWVGDLTGTLTSPSGTTVTLFSRPGGANNGANNFCQTVFSDAGATSIQSVLPAGAPYTGTYRPFEALSAFAGEDPAGTWTFKVVDGGGVDTGSIRAFSLHITPFTCQTFNSAPVANPDTYAAVEDTPLVVSTPAAGVLGNDTDADADPLTATVLTPPAHGSLALATDGTFTYTPAADYSGPDSFTYTADDGSGTPNATATGTASITVAAAPRLSIAAASGTEASGKVSFPITFTVAPAAPVDVALNIAIWPPATAITGVDVVNFLPVHHVWHPGDPLSFTIDAPLINDNLWEPDETFQVFITANGTKISGGSAVGTITGDDDDRPSLTVSGSSAAESDGTLPFTLTLSNPSARALAFTVDTHDGTATAASGDYTALSAKAVTIPAGATSVTVPVAIAADGLTEGAETLSLTATPVPGGPAPLMVVNTATGTITDAPTGPPAWSITGTTVTEPVAGATISAVFTVHLSQPAGPHGASVQFRTANGTARAPGDYNARAGMLTLAAGQQDVTIAVTVKGDRVTEPAETFTVQLRTPSPGTTIAVATATGQILNRR